MTKDELLDALSVISARCGRGDAYDIRAASGVEDHYGDTTKDEAKIRSFIEKTLGVSEESTGERLSAEGEFLRGRFAQPDDERVLGDPVQHTEGYVPCARTHGLTGRLCVLPDGHDSLLTDPSENA